MSARRNLIIAAVGILSLGVGTTTATAASEELADERERKQELADVKGESAGHGGRDARRPEWVSADSNTIAGVPRETLEAIASCESGGDRTAVSADGSYRGKYQFDTGTWGAVGGSGDPAEAPEAEQDYRAAQLYARSGTSPWPVCG